ncbi:MULTISPECIES: MacB family efflux pump subunit [unclassified Achromobacter]|uniref:MacB family efflux pump subunit n=1 Tax=unclassified Achromobacter TaxID=2626865 RepID=UPI000B51B482|nr:MULTISPECIES: MacB family efflux pump subunit [unclassified Achromobacter]OWT75738.1 macrolide ABC transporter permease/ATP-binding protein MacB [Achromobacter sp. HZ28]OWT76398.1 macrolide ABC transporter permease/ATP-binding protein MacB [Achromobacter sp. HZ34]
MVGPALIDLRDIRKSYGGTDGSPATEVLRGVSLSIAEGEFVAIMGASGSGKSTLMNILGCLDRPTSGQYRYAGQDIATFSADELAWLRREAFGFVFQGYHLIRTLDALRNVEVPAVYAGGSVRERESRARALLTRLGLDERMEHLPNQLSGGQQQRTSIARALMNGGQIILADEPTGALDSKSGAEVMVLLRELADAGHTIILITHDRDVARQARRIIEVRDGQVMADYAVDAVDAVAPTATAAPPILASRPIAGSDFTRRMQEGVAHTASAWADIREALISARRALAVNRFRTILTLLGIIIGVASVVVMMAIGAGTQAKVLEKMAVYGTNRMYVIPGSDNPRALGGTLTEADVAIVRRVPNVADAIPFLKGQVTLRAGNVDTSVSVWSVASHAPAILNWQPARGLFFTDTDERELATVVVLGKKVRQRLYGERNPVGQYVLVNNVPFQVIGEMNEKGATTGDSDDDDVALIPFSTGSRRVLGTTNLSWISVLVDDVSKAGATEKLITEALTEAHHVQDFKTFNMAAVVQAQKETQQTLTLMLGLIAAVSLLVGGIGVMNIMLMTVRERTREIGIRMATGARQRDIQRQFLSEAVVVSLVGGVAGVVIGLAIGIALIALGAPVIFSIRAILGAFACALATGLIFGFMPARQAARLDPVVALASE